LGGRIHCSCEQPERDEVTNGLRGLEHNGDDAERREYRQAGEPLDPAHKTRVTSGPADQGRQGPAPSGPEAQGDSCRRAASARSTVPDMPDFSVDSPTPVYVRVADWIESRIKSGELKPGSRLPPERELARDCGVAYDTVRRAAVLLRERGLIITVHGRGTYVA
jgi:GntR family transcriptional regulator